MRVIRSTAVEYLVVPLTTPDDITGTTVEMSFDGEVTWHAAEHVTGGVRVLIGPTGTPGAVTLQVGTYVVLVRVTDTPERPVLTAYGPVMVVDGTPDAWATVQQVAKITGQTVDDATLALAQGVIETHCGRTTAASAGMKARDLEWLKKAVAWQAAWLPSQPGYLARMGAQNIAQDGASTTFNSPADMTLAPLAQRALKNCSWMGTRSLRTTTRRQRAGEVDDSQSLEEWLRDDAEEGWVPL